MIYGNDKAQEHSGRPLEKCFMWNTKMKLNVTQLIIFLQLSRHCVVAMVPHFKNEGFRVEPSSAYYSRGMVWHMLEEVKLWP